MEDVTEKISKADSSEIEKLLKVVVERYHELFPDWEITTVSLERSADRNEQLDRMINMLQKMKTSP